MRSWEPCGPGQARRDSTKRRSTRRSNSSIFTTAASRRGRADITDSELGGSHSRRWMAIEAEHVHAKVFAETADIGRVRGTLHGVPIDISQRVSVIVENLSMSHGLNFIFGNFVIRR